MARKNIDKSTTRVITVLLPRDADGVRQDGAEVWLDDEVVMGGQNHDFHPGAHGITEYGDFKGPRGLADRIELTLLKQGYRVKVNTPPCYYDDQWEIVVGTPPVPVEPEPEPVISKTALTKGVHKRLSALGQAFEVVDAFNIDVQETTILDEVDVEVVDAWEAFEAGIDWRKFDRFLQALRKYTDFVPR
jgi:hypothetical protein